MTALLRVEELQVTRAGVLVLDVPALSLEPGSVLALIGPNGSGKTTLLKTLASLLAPASGRLLFRGEALRPEAYRRRVTMVFQQPLLFDASVRSNLEAGLRLHGLPAPERAARVAEVAQRFGMAHLLERSARNLSGGEAQRASLARAFALRPELLFLDEPFSALDPPTRDALLDDLDAALRATRTTTVLATHDQAEALRLADRLAVMHQGRILQEGPALEVINAPMDAFVAQFVGMETILSGRVAAGGEAGFRVRVAGRDLVAAGAARDGEAVQLGVRPEHVTLDLGDATGADNRFPANVTRILPRGPYFKVELDCGFPLAAHLSHLALEELGLEPGSAVVASFKATAVHVLRGPGPGSPDQGRTDG